MASSFALLSVVILMGGMFAISWAVRRSTFTTLDFYLARRQIGPSLNASAICGDYFSAASFLGVAGAVYVAGLDGIWFATGFAAGFLVLLFLVAPMRRAGQFSIPDFLANRFADQRVRLAAVGIVQVIILLYLVPQMTASGLVWEVFVGKGAGGLSAYSTGVVASTIAIVIQAVVGGMKGTTWNQALQFGLKFFTVILVSMIVIGGGFSYPADVARISNEPLAVPAQLSRAELLAQDAVGATALDRAKSVMSERGFRSVQARLRSGEKTFEVLLPVRNKLDPGRPQSFAEPGFRYTFWQQIGLIVTLLLGTAGLPHIVNRYFTTTTGRAARTATVWVLGLAGAFYFCAVLLGVAARSELPALIGPGVTNSDFVDGIVRVPEKALLLLSGGLGGRWLLTLVSAAAFAAVFSTVAGLLLAAATSWGHDVYEQFINPQATERARIRFGRVAVTVTALVAAAIGMGTPTLDFANVPRVALMVTWAFAVAGSAFTPVFLLAVWWKRTTATGALAGMMVGAVLALGLIGLDVIKRSVEWLPSIPFGSFPAVAAAPCAVVVAVGVSLAGKAPDHVTEWWLRAHGTAIERRHALLGRLAAHPEGSA